MLLLALRILSNERHDVLLGISANDWTLHVLAYRYAFAPLRYAPDYSSDSLLGTLPTGFLRGRSHFAHTLENEGTRFTAWRPASTPLVSGAEGFSLGNPKNENCYFDIATLRSIPNSESLTLELPCTAARRFVVFESTGRVKRYGP